jgi:group I intron endonuclease
MTKQNPKDRWQNGLGYRAQKRFYRAIKKYGWDSFTHEILFSGLSFEEAEQKERDLIQNYRSNDKNFGYNIESGGNCSKEMSETTREKLRVIHQTESYREKIREVNARRWADPAAHEAMSKRFSGEGNPMYGTKLSDEHKEKLLAASRAVPHRVLRGEDNPMFGKHLSDEMKAKISEANSGSRNNRARAVLCVETGVVYDCIRDAFRKTGIRFDSISSCCRGINRRAGGFHWRYADEEVSDP